MRMMSFYALSYDSGFKKIIENKKGESLKVHSIFKRVINFTDCDGQIYSILQNSLDNGPFATRVEIDNKYNFLDFNIVVNDLVEIYENSLNIENKLIISFGLAEFWSQEKLNIEVDNKNKKAFNENLKLYEEYLLQQGVNGGSKYYYIEKFIGFNSDYKASLIDKELKNRIDRFLWSVDDLNRLEDSIFKLIGFGNGLTPSGDDFLSGFISSLNKFENQRSKILFNKIKTILDKKDLSTTDISKNMISSSICGESRERITNFIKEFFNHDRNRFSNSIEEIFSIGSSSGVDLSLGIILGIMYGLDILENGGRRDEKYDSKKK